ncbi:MAG: hypothetical protein ABUT20_12770 [Bacteroidota bacterium]
MAFTNLYQSYSDLLKELSNWQSAYNDAVKSNHKENIRYISRQMNAARKKLFNVTEKLTKCDPFGQVAIN